MANAFPTTSEVAIANETGSLPHYVDWGAIIAGAVIAIAISSVFLAFGSAIGLSVSSFKAVDSAPVIGLVIAAALWLLWVQVSSFLGGAYVTGRMRRRIGDAKPHEVEMRDGAHGLIVWAVNVVIGVVLASWLTIGGIGSATSMVSNSGAMDYYVDRLVRSDGPAGPTNTSITANDNAQIDRFWPKMSLLARLMTRTSPISFAKYRRAPAWPRPTRKSAWMRPWRLSKLRLIQHAVIQSCLPFLPPLPY